MLSMRHLPSVRAMLAAVLVSGLLTACGTTTPGGTSASDARGDIDRLYKQAREELASGNNEAAVKTLERVEARAGGTLLGQQVLLELAHTQWRMNERASALATVERFIKLHPSSPAMDYALYLKGLIHFNDSLGLLGTLTRQRLSERDQQASKDAYEAFAQVLQQFPESRYAADARVRMDFIVNSLAEAEVHVARYYLRRGAYLAAANRAKQAIVDYERAPAVEEALAIMIESYDRLGLADLRDDAKRVLQRSFPSSRFLAANAPAEGRQPWWRPW
jgi:outer membrane protein assembly factor BamD